MVIVLSSRFVFSLSLLLTTSLLLGPASTSKDAATSSCGAALMEEAISSSNIGDAHVDEFNKISIAVHRSGEPEPCGVVMPSIANIREALDDLDVCGEKTLDKYQMETFLTTLIIKSLDSKESCGSTDNVSAPSGIEGYCDMSPDRTVIQNDHDKLVRFSTDGTRKSLPCRFFTREGLRVDSLSSLIALTKKAEENMKELSCAGTEQDGSCSSDSTLHLYAVPAGRMFMLAPSYIGEKFVIDHLSDEFGETIVAEVISVKPRVFELHNFFSLDEAAKIIENAERDKSETFGLHRSTTGAVNGTVYGRRTSENAWDVSSTESRAIKRLVN